MHRFGGVPGDVKSMSFFSAALWTIAATFYLDLVAGVIVAARGAEHLDLVSGVLAQSAAFLLALFFVLRIHDRESEFSNAVGIRRTNIWACALAIPLGVVLQGPASFISELVTRRFPVSTEELAARAQALHADTLAQKIALAVAACALGPAIEEMFFRGALFRGLRRGHPAMPVIFGVSALFAASHRDLTQFTPILLLSLVLTFLRERSGSLFPSLLAHASFNGVSIFAALQADTAAEEASPSLDPKSGLLGLLLAAVLVGLFQLTTRRSDRCRAARELDII